MSSSLSSLLTPDTSQLIVTVTVRMAGEASGLVWLNKARSRSSTVLSGLTTRLMILLACSGTRTN